MEKVVASFFWNISKTAKTILIKKIRRNHGISLYKKALISDNRKTYIFRDINCFDKMSVSTNVRYQFFVDSKPQKIVLISKPHFTCSFRAARLRAD